MKTWRIRHRVCRSNQDTNVGIPITNVEVIRRGASPGCSAPCCCFFLGKDMAIDNNLKRVILDIRQL